MRPLVSIVITLYNYQDYVLECLRSALAQTWPSVEVIVVDDGSSDDSVQRVRTVRDPRVRLIEKENGGQASAYEAGFAASKGEYLLFLDADDVLDPDCVEECVRRCTQGVSKVHFRLRVIDSSSRPLGHVHPRFLDDVHARDAMLRYGLYASAPGSGNFYSRRFLEAVLPFDDREDFRFGSDSWPILLAPFHGEVRSAERPLGSYRQHDAEMDRFRKVVGTASPARALSMQVRAAELVFERLRADAIVTADSRPREVAPALLRSWILAHAAAGRAPERTTASLPPERVHGRSLNLATIVRSVACWRAFPVWRRLQYGVFLCLLALKHRLAPSTSRVPRQC